MKQTAIIKWKTGCQSTITYNEPVKVIEQRFKRVKTGEIWTKVSLDSRVEGNNGYTKKVLIGSEFKTKYINIENPLKINANKAAKLRHAEQNKMLQEKICDKVQKALDNQDKLKSKLARLELKKMRYAF